MHTGVRAGILGAGVGMAILCTHARSRVNRRLNRPRLCESLGLDSELAFVWSSVIWHLSWSATIGTAAIPMTVRSQLAMMTAYAWPYMLLAFDVYSVERYGNRDLENRALRLSDAGIEGTMLMGTVWTLANISGVATKGSIVQRESVVALVVGVLLYAAIIVPNPSVDFTSPPGQFVRAAKKGTMAVSIGLVVSGILNGVVSTSSV